MRICLTTVKAAGNWLEQHPVQLSNHNDTIWDWNYKSWASLSFGVAGVLSFTVCPLFVWACRGVNWWINSELCECYTEVLVKLPGDWARYGSKNWSHPQKNLSLSRNTGNRGAFLAVFGLLMKIKQLVRFYLHCGFSFRKLFETLIFMNPLLVMFVSFF